MQINRKVFYDEVRASIFRGSFSQSQFKGMERLLDVWEQNYAKYPDEDLAYLLATSYHETAHTMQPIKERGSRSYFNRYDINYNPRKARELGNVNPGDGYLFRGEGDVQNTGRRNARFSSDRLNEVFGLDIDFEREPDMRGDPVLSAHCLFLGCIEGWWTGKKLTDYVSEERTDFVNARRVVNGLDRANLIAGYAECFAEAVAAARKVPATLDDVMAKPPVTGKTWKQSTTNIAGAVAAGATTVSTVAATTGEVKEAVGGPTNLLILICFAMTVAAVIWIFNERRKKKRQYGV